MSLSRHFSCIALASASMSASAGEPNVSHSSSERQIWAYSAAALSFIGEGARVMDQNNDTLREGNTTPMVVSKADSHE